MGSDIRFEERVIAGRYRLTGRLGRGGMAEVYRARDTLLDRDVAVKLFRSSTDDVGHRRFEEEARILARLAHPGLVTVHDAGFSESEPFLVMRLVVGRTLAARLADGPLPVPEVLDLARQLTRILAYVHDTGIVHRDVKPSNVLLADDGQAYLADFGISRLVDTGDRVTAAGKIMGTVGYLSPEQVLGADATQAVDVYALGLVLLECVTGRQEYDGSGVEGAIARLHRPPRVPEELSAPLSTVIHAMTATKAEQRPSMAECVTVLDGTARSRLPPARRRWTVVGAVVAGAAAVAAISAPLLTGADQPVTQSPVLPRTTTHQDEAGQPAATTPPPDPALAPGSVTTPRLAADHRISAPDQPVTGTRVPVTTIGAAHVGPTARAAHGNASGGGTGNTKGAGRDNGRGPRH